MATPDLAEIVRTYLDADWKVRSGLMEYGYDWLDNPCEMLNLSLREWGHKHVLDEIELTRLGRLAGLEPEGVRAHGLSGYPPFNGLETRAGRHLILEFRKPIHEPSPAEPLVSVLIPAFTPRWFEAALLSARSQTHTHLEILVGDDSPGGEIAEIAQRHAAEDPRIRYRCNPASLGELRNYQVLLERARGVYVKPLADDDLLEPTCVERLVDVLERHPGVTLASARRRLIDEAGGDLPETFNRPLVDGDVRIAGPEAAALMLAQGRNWVGEPTCALFRRSDVRDVRPLMMSFGGRRIPTNADVAIWLNLLGRGDLVLLAAPLSRFRQHGEQVSRSAEHLARALDCWEMLRQDAVRLGLWNGAAPSVDPIELHGEAPAPTPAPEVSLLLPVAGPLPPLLAGSERLSRETLERPLEFIVIDTGLAPAARRYFERTTAATPGARLLDGVESDVTAALLRGAEAAAGPLLALADLTAPLSVGWLARAIDALEAAPATGAVSDTSGQLVAARRERFASYLSPSSQR
jgi:hypothetical protein